MGKNSITRGGVNPNMLIYNSQYFISPITRQYFARVNAAGGDVQDKKAINDFVIGLSRIVDPSLWVCWPLRSSQSVGTGTNAPSLGLLGDFPGTLINGPTWGADGITFDGSTNYISLNATGVFRDQSAGWLVGVAKDTNLAGGTTSHFVASFTINNATQLRTSIATKSVAVAFQAVGRRTDADVASVANSGISNENWNFLEHRSDWGAGTHRITVNGSASLTSAYSSGSGNTSDTNSSIVSIGSTGGINYFPGSISFVLACRSLPSLAVAEQVRALYKSTLGQGLGLP